MKLRYLPTSPYVRKVMVTAHEIGLTDKIELIPTDPWDPKTDLGLDNPLGRVPALVLDGGETLFDSPVICEYLDSLHDGVKLFPPAGGARWSALRRMAMGAGIMDACILRRVEDQQRPKEYQYQPWLDRQKMVIAQTLDVLEDAADSYGDMVSIGEIAIAVALCYIDLRFYEDNWRADRPALADWHDGFTGRPSMMATDFAEWSG